MAGEILTSNDNDKPNPYKSLVQRISVYNCHRNHLVLNVATRAKSLTLPEVNGLIQALMSKPEISEADLLAFAKAINGGEFKTPVAPKAKPLSMAEAKEHVLNYFDCKSASDLRKNKNFMLSMTGEDFSLKTKEDWLKLYRKFIGVPKDERDGHGPSFVNGIDVLENFRPWHVFGLDPETAKIDDIKRAFRELAKVHHPDAGGDPRVFERLQKMRDSVIALIK